ncbi:aldehyde dehydrogenase family protein [Streptomyces cellulosae]|uniref:Aldehyde dehydrogenase family protein n=1 Tax=Streptomyces cellulosae TaxID=1968 RepID=A0ABW7XW68_STRCE
MTAVMTDADQPAERVPLVDPRTERLLGETPLLPPSGVDRVARVAAAAFRRWADVTVGERCYRVREMACLLEESIPEVATAFSREHGKTEAEAAMEVARAVDTLRWSADEAERATAATPLPERAGMVREVLVDPAGPVLAIVPWNFPAVVLARKLGPALVMGCSVVVKAADETPSVTDAFAVAARQAGLPEGTVQVVHAAPEVADALVRRREFGAVSFTGSARVGRLVAAGAASTSTPCVLELGGHAPVIVTADADLDAAVAALVAVKFSSAGQSCGAPSRFLVDRRVHAQFVERFTALAPACDYERDSGGRPGTMGPLNNARRRAEVHKLVLDAVHRGARIRLGGRLPDTAGYYYPATVLTDVPVGARILKEEPFGPLAPVVAYDDDRQAVELANEGDYALAAYVFGEPDHARRLGVDVDAGSVSVNFAAGAVPDAPLGGRRTSGYGYEGGVPGLLAFGRLKTLQCRVPDSAGLEACT